VIQKKLLSELIKNYILLEKKLQKKINDLCKPFCSKCANPCCKEVFCRESIDSSFLYILIKKQDVKYDNGWIGSHGCRLSYGRPPVCYEFFCGEVTEKEHLKGAQVVQEIKRFISAGNKACGNEHLICVNDLSKISEQKIQKSIKSIKAIM